MLEEMTQATLISALARRWEQDLEKTLEGVTAPRAALKLYMLERDALFKAVEDALSKAVEDALSKEMARLQRHPAFADGKAFVDAFIDLALKDKGGGR